MYKEGDVVCIIPIEKKYLIQTPESCEDPREVVYSLAGTIALVRGRGLTGYTLETEQGIEWDMEYEESEILKIGVL